MYISAFYYHLLSFAYVRQCSVYFLYENHFTLTAKTLRQTQSTSFGRPCPSNPSLHSIMQHFPSSCSPFPRVGKPLEKTSHELSNAPSSLADTQEKGGGKSGDLRIVANGTPLNHLTTFRPIFLFMTPTYRLQGEG